MNGKYAFFLDIDGTLWNRGVIPQENIETINKIRKLGHYVFVNTGRSRGFIPDSLFEQLDFDGVVSGIGCSITYNGEYLLLTSLTSDDIKYVTDFFKETNRTVVMGSEKHVYYFAKGKCGRHGKEFKKRFETEEFFQNPYFHYISSYKQWEKDYNKDPISKITVWGDVLDEEENVLMNRFFTINHKSEHYFEIGTKGINKATGMLKCIEKLGIPLDHCVAMGDGENDTDMLKAAGISVAMGNAIDEVKEMSTMTTDVCTNAGVSKAIKKIIGIE